jgi:hypothetical protein
MISSEVIFWLRAQMTQTHRSPVKTVLKDVRVDVSNRTPILSNVYSERKRVFCRLVINIEHIVRKVLPFAILLI